MAGRQAETAIWRSVMLALSPLGCRLFRNQRYKGPIVRAGQITSAFADCGLCDGASDIVGWRSIIITPDMVGKRIAQMVAIETKTAAGVTSNEQKRFVDAVCRAGGIAGVVRSADEAIELLKNARLLA